MMAARFWCCPKRNPARSVNLRASVQSPPSAVAKALGAILAPTLTPCTAWLVRPALGAVHDFSPCSCPARPCWRRPLEREPAQVAPENAKSGDLGGGSNTLNTATVGGCSSHRPCWLHTPAPSGENHGQSSKPCISRVRERFAQHTTPPPSSECAGGSSEVASLRLFGCSKGIF